MRIGVTGHTNLTADSVPLVAEAIDVVLAEVTGPVTEVSCLARGADQVFAGVVLDLGHRLEVVLPAADYRERKVEPDDRDRFEQLIGRATHVETLPFTTSGRAAYAAAGDRVLSGIERLIAVWDGTPPDGRGGTGDTVRLTRERGLPVTVVWPAGARRG